MGVTASDINPPTSLAVKEENKIVHNHTAATILPQVEAEPQSGDLEKNAATVNEKPTGPLTGAFDPRDNPDGGLDAWLVVLGGCCCLFCSFGWVNCKVVNLL